jgi:hypothetical protein
VRAGDGGDQNAVREVWRAWLADLDEERWELLARWREPAGLAARVFDEAVSPRRDASERAAIGAFCARHGLAPRDGVRMALFYVLTGQADQHRAADPDGALLATAYQGAHSVTRAALRQALAGAGDLDLVHVLASAGAPDDAGAPGRASQLASEEASYLCGQLAGRADWPQLWRLALNLPLAETVAAMRLFDTAWRPADDRGLHLFCLLAAADPGEIAWFRNVASGILQMTLPGHYVNVEFGTLSGDARRLIVGTWDGPPAAAARRMVVTVFDLIGGTVMEHHELPDCPHACAFSYLADAVVTSTPSGQFTRHQIGGPGAGQATSWSGGEDVFGLQVLGEDSGGLFVALGRDHLIFCASDGRVTGRWPHGGRLSPIRSRRDQSAPSLLAAHRPSGRLAIAGVCGLSVIDARDPGSARRIACVDDHTGRNVSSVLFCGPDYLVTIVLLALREEKMWQHAVRHLRADTLADAEGPRELSGPPGSRLWGSADNTTYAAYYGWYPNSGYYSKHPGTVNVAVPVLARLATLARRPLSTAGPADLAPVLAAAADPRLPRAAAPLARLLGDVLRQQFGDDIRVGPAVPAAGADEISL